jgi:hypothetical protein
VSFSPFCWPNPKPPDPSSPKTDRSYTDKSIAEVGRTGRAGLCRNRRAGQQYRYINNHKTARFEKRFVRANLIETELLFDSKSHPVLFYCSTHALVG